MEDGGMQGERCSWVWVVVVLACLWSGTGALWGQAGGEVDREFRARNIKTLVSLKEVIEETELALAEKRELKESASTEEETEDLAKEIDQLRNRSTGLREEFAKLATGVGEAEYERVGEEVSELSEELEQMGRLLVSEFNDATASARELEDMRATLSMLAQREDLANRALVRLAVLEEGELEEDLKVLLERSRTAWEGRLAEVSSQKDGLNLRLQHREAENVSLIESLWGMVGSFCTQRGRNLLVAVLVFVGTNLILRWFHYFIRKYGPLHRTKRGSFLVRVLDVLYGTLTVAIALLAAFGVLYSAGDWLLVSLGFIFVVGLLWTMKNTLPAVFEQVKLVLNLGPVREGERFVHGGLPWKVDSLGFYSEFSNPELTGGVLRLPLRALIDENSRPYTEKEPWFPSSTNDWVILSDSTYGKVVSQTPEQVIVLKLGGSRVFYRTDTFLGLNPENLSRNFRIDVVFGIDYAHQADVTTTIREVFETRTNAELISLVGEEGLISLKVEFREAGASSLDFELIADFSGEIASKYNTLHRAIQRICVDICNENGWVIPFTQVTVHQAG